MSAVPVAGRATRAMASSNMWPLGFMLSLYNYRRGCVNHPGEHRLEHSHARNQPELDGDDQDDAGGTWADECHPETTSDAERSLPSQPPLISKYLVDRGFNVGHRNRTVTVTVGAARGKPGFGQALNHRKHVGGSDAAVAVGISRHRRRRAGARRR